MGIGSRLELFVDHHLIDEKCVKNGKRDSGEVKIAVSEWSFANYSETKANPELGTYWSTALWSADCIGHFIKNNFWLAAYWRVEGDYHGFLLHDPKTDRIKPKPTFYTFKFLRKHSHTDDTREGNRLLKANKSTTLPKLTVSAAWS